MSTESDPDMRLTFSTLTVKERMDLWRKRDGENKQDQSRLTQNKITTITNNRKVIENYARKRLSVSTNIAIGKTSCVAFSNQLPSVAPISPTSPKSPSISVQSTPDLSPSQRKSQQNCGGTPAAQIPANITEARGVTLAFLHSFVETCGGRSKLVGFSTEQVCAQFIIPRCIESGKSFSESSSSSSGSGMHTANWFVSHSAAAPFLGLVDALSDTLADLRCPDDALWIDVFSLPQLGAATAKMLTSNSWLKRTLPKLIRATGKKVLAVVAPWEDPAVLKRLNCLYEWFLCYQLQGRFHGATTSVERELLLQSVMADHDLFFSVLGDASSERATGGSEQETATLRALVCSTVPATASSNSFQSLDAIAYHLMDCWLERLLLSRCSEGNTDGAVTSMQFQLTLAAIYESKERPAQAEAQYRACLSSHESIYGEKNTQTLAVLGRLASVLQIQGKGSEARPLLERCLRTQRELLGQDNPQTIMTAASLAMLLDTEGEFDAAEVLYSQVLDAQTRTLGPTHTATLGTLNDLAMLQESRGDCVRALETYQRCFAVSQSALGVDHPDTLITMTNLAGLHESMGQVELAERLFLAALEASRRVLGETHPDTLSRMAGLAALYYATRQLDRAEPLFVACYEGRKNELGPTHAATLKTANNLAALFKSSGRLDQAVELFQICLTQQRDALGPDHPDTLDTLDNLAVSLEAQGRHQEAEPLLLQVYEARKAADTLWRSGCEMDEGTMKALYDLAECVYARGDFARSEQYFNMYNDQIKRQTQENET